MKYLVGDNEFLDWCRKKHIQERRHVEGIALYVAMLHKVIGADYNNPDVWNMAYTQVVRIDVEDAIKTNRLKDSPYSKVLKPTLVYTVEKEK